MFRLTNIFALLFVFISFLFVADAQTVGAYSKTPLKDYKDLKIKLQNSNIKSAIGANNSNVKVMQITDAYQQVVAGMNYRIVTLITINGKLYQYCFLVFQSLPQPKQTFTVQCASKLTSNNKCPCFK